MTDAIRTVTLTPQEQAAYASGWNRAIEAAAKEAEATLAYGKAFAIPACIRALSIPAPAQEWRVKPLEWHEAGGNFPTQKVWSADGLPWFWVVQNDGGSYIWCEDITPSWAPASGVKGSYATLESAKAAAQEDFAARVMAMVDVVPAPPQPMEGGE